MIYVPNTQNYIQLAIKQEFLSDKQPYIEITPDLAIIDSYLSRPEETG